MNANSNTFTPWLKRERLISASEPAFISSCNLLGINPDYVIIDAYKAEEEISKYLTKSYRPGAVYWPNACNRYSRKIHFVRKASGWYLCRVDQTQRPDPYSQLFLTEAQAEKAATQLRFWAVRQDDLPETCRFELIPGNRGEVDGYVRDEVGRAHAHCWDCADDIYGLAEDAQTLVRKSLGDVTRKDPPVYVTFRSGSHLPNAYRYSRQVTEATLKLEGGTWYLVHFEKTLSWAKDGTVGLHLTPEQDKRALYRLSRFGRLPIVAREAA